VAPETAGDPMGGAKWVRSSLRHLSARLGDSGHAASPPTVGRLLRKLGYSPKASRKEREAGEGHPDREAQFAHIEAEKQAHLAAGQPVVSVDTKKKELIGDFKNGGRAWCREPEAVNVHDFRSDALGRAVPYGVYDLARNRGYVAVGTSADTPEFAVAAIRAWWEGEGAAAYPGADRLLVLADGGGSNGYRARLWKQQLQERLCDPFGLTVTVCHYPPGCSKWNPVEHRLFGPISVNWAGRPLRSWEVMLACLRGTSTAAGLSVAAHLDGATYEKGRSVSDEAMSTLDLTPHDVCPRWSYTLRPRSHGPPPTPPEPSATELISL
jgi:Rhodopirellula transposase DDE domain